MIRVAVQPEPIDLAAELACVELAGAGGIASFTGLVRADDGVSELELEHYPGMTEAALTALAEEARSRWALLAVNLVHRIGRMTPGERIVFVATAAPHRAAALESCAFLIDRLKSGAPFWKRERRGESANWVEAREADAAAVAKWV